MGSGVSGIGVAGERFSIVASFFSVVVFAGKDGGGTDGATQVPPPRHAS